MLPMRISNATRVLAETQDEFHALAIKDEIDPASGANMMISLWEPTPEELAHLNAGGFVRLSIMGGAFFPHPKGFVPVLITTQAPPGLEEG